MRFAGAETTLATFTSGGAAGLRCESRVHPKLLRQFALAAEMRSAVLRRKTIDNKYLLI